MKISKQMKAQIATTMFQIVVGELTEREAIALALENLAKLVRGEGNVSNP